MKISLMTALLLCLLYCKAQRGPLTFEIAHYDSVLPPQPQSWALPYKGVKDTIDYRGRRIKTEIFLSIERTYDTQGRLVAEVHRNGDNTVSQVQKWDYRAEGVVHTLIHYNRDSTAYTSTFLFPAGKVIGRPAAGGVPCRRLSESRLVDGKWNLYYSAEYDSTGKLLRQFEDTRVYPNQYFTGGILNTKYFYDAFGRCTGYVTINDSAKQVSEFRCRYNSAGLIEVWDHRNSAMGIQTYDSLAYDEAGNTTYAVRRSAHEATKEYLLEYDRFGKVIRCQEKVDGELTTDRVYNRENGLLLSETITQYQSGKVTTTRSSRRYEFYE